MRAQPCAKRVSCMRVDMEVEVTSLSQSVFIDCRLLYMRLSLDSRLVGLGPRRRIVLRTLWQEICMVQKVVLETKLTFSEWISNFNLRRTFSAYTTMGKALE